MKLETDRGHFFVDGVRRTDITQEQFDDMVRLDERRRSYRAYHEQVVAACVALMGEQVRFFLDQQCSYEEEFAADEDPKEVAMNQCESLD